MLAPLLAQLANRSSEDSADGGWGAGYFFLAFLAAILLMIAARRWLKRHFPAEEDAGEKVEEQNAGTSACNPAGEERLSADRTRGQRGG